MNQASENLQMNHRPSDELLRPWRSTSINPPWSGRIFTIAQTVRSPDLFNTCNTVVLRHSLKAVEGKTSIKKVAFLPLEVLHNEGSNTLNIFVCDLLQYIIYTSMKKWFLQISP